MIKESDLKVLFDAEAIQQEIAKLGKQLNNIYKDEEIYLICVLKGSVMFMADLAKHLKMPLKNGIYKAFKLWFSIYYIRKS